MRALASLLALVAFALPAAATDGCVPVDTLATVCVLDDHATPGSAYANYLAASHALPLAGGTASGFVAVGQWMFDDGTFGGEGVLAVAQQEVGMPGLFLVSAVGGAGQQGYHNAAGFGYNSTSALVVVQTFGPGGATFTEVYVHQTQDAGGCSNGVLVIATVTGAGADAPCVVAVPDVPWLPDLDGDR